MKNINRKYLLFGALGIIVLWGLSWFLLSTFIDKQDKRGQFGDMFGAINSLFSGLALCGIAYTIFLQYESNKNSEYQFKFNHLLDTVNRQVTIFNERIIEFNLYRETYIGIEELKFNESIQYYKTIKFISIRLEEFVKLNNANINEIMSFIYHSEKFVYNYIDHEDINDVDKGKLKQLYERSLNRLKIDFLSLCTINLKLIKDKSDSITNPEMKMIDDEISGIQTSMLKAILTQSYI